MEISKSKARLARQQKMMEARIAKSKLKWQRREAQGKAAKAKIIPEKIEKPKKVPEVVEKKVLIDIEGIGPGRAKKLEGIGIKTIEDLAKASPKKISEKLDVAIKEALRWIKQAKE